MKIGSFEPKGVLVPLQGERGSGAASRLASSKTSAEVMLSAMGEFRLDPNGEGSFDSAKVERISQAIREGKFTIDAGAIADQLISNARELLEQTPKP
ncbi:MAG: flagellar biosynthesis anti-sigma factor FlgM [Rubrivivax sp.]